MTDRHPIRVQLETAAYTALRIVAGLMFTYHGLQKLTGWMMPGGKAVAFASQAWFGGVIELVGGVLIALGFLTWPAALLASGTMAVAYIQFHWKLDFASWRWLPSVNKGELAVLYCFVFLFIAARGGGRASIDALIWRRPR
jgi:putative oxidoreductase